MKRLISAVLLSAAVVVPTMAKNAKTLGNGYPFTQATGFLIIDSPG